MRCAGTLLLFILLSTMALSQSIYLKHGQSGITGSLDFTGQKETYGFALWAGFSPEGSLSAAFGYGSTNLGGDAAARIFAGDISYLLIKQDSLTEVSFACNAYGALGSIFSPQFDQHGSSLSVNTLGFGLTLSRKSFLSRWVDLVPHIGPSVSFVKETFSPGSGSSRSSSDHILYLNVGVDFAIHSNERINWLFSPSITFNRRATTAFALSFGFVSALSK